MPKVSKLRKLTDSERAFYKVVKTYSKWDLILVVYCRMAFLFMLATSLDKTEVNVDENEPLWLLILLVLLITSILNTVLDHKVKYTDKLKRAVIADASMATTSLIAAEYSKFVRKQKIGWLSILIVFEVLRHLFGEPSFFVLCAVFVSGTIFGNVWVKRENK